MSEREIEVTIAAVQFRLDFSLKLKNGERIEASAEERAALYGARDALEIELRRIRARRPSL